MELKTLQLNQFKNHNQSSFTFSKQVNCFVGDNGAGKSTLIKVLSGVHPLTEGEIKVDGVVVNFSSPRQASDSGIGTVYQDLALNALTSVTRNFFLGRELKKGPGPFGIMNMKDRVI